MVIVCRAFDVLRDDWRIERWVHSSWSTEGRIEIKFKRASFFLIAKRPKMENSYKIFFPGKSFSFPFVMIARKFRILFQYLLCKYGEKRRQGIKHIQSSVFLALDISVCLRARIFIETTAFFPMLCKALHKQNKWLVNVFIMALLHRFSPMMAIIDPSMLTSSFSYESSSQDFIR